MAIFRWAPASSEGLSLYRGSDGGLGAKVLWREVCVLAQPVIKTFNLHGDGMVEQRPSSAA